MSDVDGFLAHFGRKGMKWGVVNDKSDGGSGGGSKASGSPKPKGKPKVQTDSMEAAFAAYQAKHNPKSLQAEGAAKKKAQANQVAAHEPGSKRTVVAKKASDSKKPVDGASDLPDVKPSGMSRKQKIALGVGAAAAVGVLAYAGNKQMKGVVANLPGMGMGGNFTAPKSKSAMLAAKHKAEMDAIFGEGSGKKSLLKGEGYFHAGLYTKRALDRPGFELPASTIFQRLSDHKETGSDYSKGMYSTFLHNDNKSYSGSTEFGSKGYTLNFKPDKPVKVPSTRQVLDAVREVNAAQGLKGDAKTALDTYHAMSGGDWGSGQNKMLVDNLKKKGYSAIVDDMDAGFLGDLPLVFFGSTSKVVATERASDTSYNDALQSVEPDRRYA